MKYQAILLIGPTGTGKTPLGRHLEACGLSGKRCCHFDFGQQLRNAVAGKAVAALLTGQERRFLRSLLKQGLLLDDKDFHLARKILRAFLLQQQATGAEWVILNGLPRHVSQAQAVAGILTIRQVIYLQATPQVVEERLRSDSGGDRNGRQDDQLELVKQKLEIFTARTLPLLEYYRTVGVKTVTVNIGVETTPAEITIQIS